MLEYLSTNTNLVNHLKRSGVLITPSIEKAFLSADRKLFVGKNNQEFAYYDEALQIPASQTISQPYTVAFMLEELAAQKGERILDVGVGSGWSMALLSHITGPEGYVYGVERKKELVEFANANLKKIKHTNFSVEQSGVIPGLPEKAPFDRILVSASSNSIPKELINQLKNSGVMVIPVRNSILRIKKIDLKNIDVKKYDGFVFVPLVLN